MFLMQQAAHCTLLIEALISSARSIEPKCVHSEDVDKSVSLMAYYSKEETKQKLIIPADATQGETYEYDLGSKVSSPCKLEP